MTAPASAGCHGDQMKFLVSTKLSTCPSGSVYYTVDVIVSWALKWHMHGWGGHICSCFSFLAVLSVARDQNTAADAESKRLVSSFHLSAICPYRLFKNCAGLRLVRRAGH